MPIPLLGQAPKIRRMSRHPTHTHRLMQRQREPELMDQPELDASQHRHALAGLARVNRWSRSAAIFWPALERLARSRAPQTLRVLDLACGGGDVTVALARRFAAAGLPVELTGVDRSATALEVARKRANQAGVTVEFRTLDVLADPLPEGFDACICSLFLHHLDEADAVRLMSRMAESTPQLVLVNDLVRSRVGYGLAVLATRLLTRSHVVHVDGPLSVAAAFTPSEAMQLAEQAGWHGVTLSRHWPCRFLLTWKRP